MFVHLLFQFVQLKSWILCMFTRELMLFPWFCRQIFEGNSKQTPEKKNQQQQHQNMCVSSFVCINFNGMVATSFTLWCRSVRYLGNFVIKFIFCTSSHSIIFIDLQIISLLLCACLALLFFSALHSFALFILRMTTSSVQRFWPWPFIKFTVAGHAKTWQHFHSQYDSFH